MSYFLRFFKFFLQTAIIFGILTCSFMVVFRGGINTGISLGIKLGLIFSICLTGIGLYNDYIFRRWVFAKLKVKNFDISQRREIYLKENLMLAFSRTLNVLRIIPSVKQINPDIIARKISAKTGGSILSFGELIEVELSQEAKKTKVVIYSMPRLKATVADCGKNIENVEIITALLKDERIGKQLIQKVSMPSIIRLVILFLPFAISALVFIFINN